MERRIPRRTMKENCLEEEVYRIRKMRGQVDPSEEYKHKLALEFLGSSAITKKILEEKGYKFEGKARPISSFNTDIFSDSITESLISLKKKGNEKPSCYSHYFGSPPNLKRIRQLGCEKCQYWTYEDDSCPLVSIKDKTKKQKYKSK